MIPTDNTAGQAGDAAAHTICEIEFKGSRRDFFACPETISPKTSDYVIVQADRGEHIGRFVRSGPRSAFPSVKELKSILRIASYADVEILVDNARRERDAFEVCLGKIAAHDLKMKLVDVEYQFDGNKICFYFTADKRIDFRALVKDLASEYRTRIELRQIGVRDEARRLGGLGVCGRALCCKTFLGQFEPITSQMARDQNLSLSPTKISGLCGRLMCCLAYEETFYRNQAEAIPGAGSVVENEGRRYEVAKVDIFNESVVLRETGGAETRVSMAEFSAYTVIQAADGNGRCGRCAGKNHTKSSSAPAGNGCADTNGHDTEAFSE